MQEVRAIVGETIMDTPAHVLDERPWERPGSFRRDCQPHRGEFLTLVGNWGLGCGSFFCFVTFGCLLGGTLSWFVILPTFAWFGLGTAVWRMAARDLETMRAGVTDPGGSQQTEDARDKGVIVMMLNGCCWAFYLVSLGLHS